MSEECDSGWRWIVLESWTPFRMETKKDVMELDGISPSEGLSSPTEFRVRSRDGVCEGWLPVGSEEPKSSPLALLGAQPPGTCQVAG